MPAQKARPFSAYNPPGIGTPLADREQGCRDQALQEIGFDCNNHSGKLLEGSRPRRPRADLCLGRMG